MLRNWRGEQITNKVLIASAQGINAVMSACVRMSKGQHPPVVRTSTYQGSIQLREAKLMRDGVVGYWGSFNVDYAKYLEFKKFSHVGLLRPLRNAADVFYPTLAETIKLEFMRL